MLQLLKKIGGAISGLTDEKQSVTMTGVLCYMFISCILSFTIHEVYPGHLRGQRVHLRASAQTAGPSPADTLVRA